MFNRLRHVGRFVVVLLAARSVLADPQAESKGKDEIKLVSMFQLLATPETFEGQMVRVAGFCLLEFESELLFFHKEDFYASLAPNSIALEFKGRTPEKYRAMSEVRAC